jgi:hypothetical protein
VEPWTLTITSLDPYSFDGGGLGFYYTPHGTLTGSIGSSTLTLTFGESADGGGPLDASLGASGPVSAPHCQPGGPGLSDCGANRESCCTSLEVQGGTFDRSYDLGDAGTGFPPPSADGDSSIWPVKRGSGPSTSKLPT